MKKVVKFQVELHLLKLSILSDSGESSDIFHLGHVSQLKAFLREENIKESPASPKSPVWSLTELHCTAAPIHNFLLRGGYFYFSGVVTFPFQVWLFWKALDKVADLLPSTISLVQTGSFIVRTGEQGFCAHLTSLFRVPFEKYSKAAIHEFSK